MVTFLRYQDAVPSAEVATLSEAILGSPYVGRSQLAGTFKASRGFGIAGRARDFPLVRERFPMLGPFLDVRLRGSPHRRFAPLSKRLGPLPEPNAFYLNLLVIDDGAGVGRHIDGTLQEPTGLAHLTPAFVTVLYLKVPERRAGGDLVLFQGPAPIATIEPEEGTLVHFRGDLAHEIQPLEGASGLRVSLVCEQYLLPPDALARLGEPALQTRAPDMPFAGARKKASFGALLRRDEPS